MGSYSMQQDPFLYQAYPDPRLQYPNAGSFPAQANVQSPWPGSRGAPFVPNLNQVQNVPSPYNSGGGSWAHTVPSLMPWVAQEDVDDPVMRFTAPFPPDPCTSQTATSWELLNNLGARTNANMHLKRKSDPPAQAPHKMCITEERMSARLRELHISNQYSVPTESSPFGPYSSHSPSVANKPPVTNLQQLEAMIQGASQSEGSAKSLVLAPELKKLVEPEKIFASTFLDKIERPSMAVVLWQPQNKLLPNVNNNSEDEEKERTAIRNSSSEDIMDT